jgi:hypothetical protein
MVPNDSKLASLDAAREWEVAKVALDRVMRAARPAINEIEVSGVSMSTFEIRRL